LVVTDSLDLLAGYRPGILTSGDPPDRDYGAYHSRVARVRRDLAPVAAVDATRDRGFAITAGSVSKVGAATAYSTRGSCALVLAFATLVKVAGGPSHRPAAYSDCLATQAFSGSLVKSQ